jgi:hypothetical protein
MRRGYSGFADRAGAAASVPERVALVDIAEIQDFVEFQNVVFLTEEGDVVLDIEVRVLAERVFDLIGVIVEAVGENFFARYADDAVILALDLVSPDF